MTIGLSDKLYKDILSYCELNQLEMKKYVNDLLKKAFMLDKYGEKPGIQQKEPVEVKEQKTEIVDGGVVVEVVEEKKPEEPVIEKVEIDEDFNHKDMELNKALKDGVFNKELSEETPVVVEKPKRRKLK